MHRRTAHRSGFLFEQVLKFAILTASEEKVLLFPSEQMVHKTRLIN
jgi:hypothetical protein